MLVIPAKVGIVGCGEPQANRIVAIFGARASSPLLAPAFAFDSLLLKERWGGFAFARHPAKAAVAGCGEPQANRIVAIFGACASSPLLAPAFAFDSLFMKERWVGFAFARHPREGGDPVTSALRRVLLRMMVSKVNGFRLLRMRVTFSCWPKRK